MNASKKRLVFLDLIRIFSCLCVSISHFNAKLSGMSGSGMLYNNTIIPSFYLGNRVYLGDIGVSLFFMLSGASQMLSYREEKAFSFYKRRFLGLFPMFWIAYILITFCDFMINKGMALSPLWHYAFSVVGMDGYIPTLGLMPITSYKTGEWFLGCILLLFLLFPLLYRGVKRRPAITVAAALAVYVFFEVHPAIGKYDISGAEFFLRIPELLFGMFFVKYRLWERKKSVIATIGSAVVFGIAMLLRDRLFRLSLTIAFCLVLFNLLTAASKAFMQDNSKRALSQLAGLTYPVFLVHHYLIYKLVIGFSLENMTRTNIVMLFIVFIALTLALSWLLKKAGDRAVRLRVFTGIPATLLWGVVLLGVVTLPIVSVTAYAAAPEAPVASEGSEAIADIPAPQGYDAVIESHSTPETVERGRKYDFEIVALNTGTEAWSEAKQIRLCIWQDGTDWGYRLLIPEGKEVAPGERFSFKLIGFGAPPTDSTCLEYQMVEEGVQYFGERARTDIAIIDQAAEVDAETDADTDIDTQTTKAREASELSTAANETGDQSAEPEGETQGRAKSDLETLENCDAQIVSHSTPEQVNRYGLYDIDIVVANTGTETWSEARGIRLCVFQDGQDYGYRFQIPEGEEVAPGEQFTFHIHGFGAPQSNGKTELEYQMVRGDAGFFGEKAGMKIAISD